MGPGTRARAASAVRCCCRARCDPGAGRADPRSCPHRRILLLVGATAAPGGALVLAHASSLSLCLDRARASPTRPPLAQGEPVGPPLCLQAGQRGLGDAGRRWIDLIWDSVGPCQGAVPSHKSRLCCGEAVGGAGHKPAAAGGAAARLPARRSALHPLPEHKAAAAPAPPAACTCRGMPARHPRPLFVLVVTAT